MLFNATSPRMLPGLSQVCEDGRATVVSDVADPILISGSHCDEERAQVIENNSPLGHSIFIIGLILPAWFLPSPQATSKQMTGQNGSFKTLGTASPTSGELSGHPPR